MAQIAQPSPRNQGLSIRYAFECCSSSHLRYDFSGELIILFILILCRPGRHHPKPLMNTHLMLPGCWESDYRRSLTPAARLLAGDVYGASDCTRSREIVDGLLLHLNLLVQVLIPYLRLRLGILYHTKNCCVAETVTDGIVLNHAQGPKKPTE